MSCNCFDKPIRYESDFLRMFQKSHCQCNARFLAKENNKRFLLTNASIEDVEKIKVDGALIQDKTTTRCDYLFIHNKKLFLFVELKGTDIPKAVKQIESTIELISNNKIMNKDCRVVCCIVSSSHPNNNGSYRNAMTLLKKKWGQKFASINMELKANTMNYDAIREKAI